MAMEAKGLIYRSVEVTPGLGQLSIFKLSGQRQVPIIIDGETAIADSTAIIRYLDDRHPETKLIPQNPKEAAQVELIEDWADTTFAKSTKSALLQAAAFDKHLRAALIPEEVPTYLRTAFSNVDCDWIGNINELIDQDEQNSLLSSLEKISDVVKDNQWLVGDSISAADIAVAAQLSLLKFPCSSGNSLKGKGCPQFINDPRLQSLFDWRDKLEMSFLEKRIN